MIPHLWGQMPQSQLKKEMEKRKTITKNPSLHKSILKTDHLKLNPVLLGTSTTGSKESSSSVFGTPSNPEQLERAVHQTLDSWKKWVYSFFLSAW